jgi:hypothetical protein
MLKYLTKFASDILPSVAATIIGAYIVNHYITSKPAIDAPAAVSSVDARKATGNSDAAPKVSTDLANILGAGVRAKGISEKSIQEKSAPEKAAPEKAAEKATEKPAGKPELKSAETGSTPQEGRRHPPVLHEKAVAKSVVAPAQPVVTPSVPATTEAAVTPDEHRDANDLARAAIERLRGASEVSTRPQDTAHMGEPRSTPTPQGEAPRVAAAPVRPLPPPVMVSSPAGETFDSMTGSVPPTPDAAATAADPMRPTPPADIPDARPLDLRADAGAPPERRRTVADDMLSAAKSVFHAVLPQ